MTPVFSILACEVEDVLKSETQQNQSVMLVKKKKKKKIIGLSTSNTDTVHSDFLFNMCSLSTGQFYYFLRIFSVN